MAMSGGTPCALVVGGELFRIWINPLCLLYASVLY